MERFVGDTEGRPVVSIVIPAHNEEHVLPRLLDALLSDAQPGEFTIVVVCNGCTDATASRARIYGQVVEVLDIPEPSKQRALARGDELATDFPRMYIDADVVLTTEDIRQLCAALGEGALAAAPERELSRQGIPIVVRWYYDVWERLPAVQTGLFGRGAIALSAEGHMRRAALPPVLADDLVLSEAFGLSERVVVKTSHVQIFLPRSVRDLVRRRTRVVIGATQAESASLARNSTRTSLTDLLTLVRREPSMAVRMIPFLAVTAWARLAAARHVRSGDFGTWHRDSSSREELH